MTQFSVNLNDETTGHKLQGMSKDNLIKPVFPNNRLEKLFKNWEYVVLSCVRSRHGLYVLKKIDMDESFEVSTTQNESTCTTKNKAGKIPGAQQIMSEDTHHSNRGP